MNGIVTLPSEGRPLHLFSKQTTVDQERELCFLFVEHRNQLPYRLTLCLYGPKNNYTLFDDYVEATDQCQLRIPGRLNVTGRETRFFCHFFIRKLKAFTFSYKVYTTKCNTQKTNTCTFTSAGHMPSSLVEYWDADDVIVELHSLMKWLLPRNFDRSFLKVTGGGTAKSEKQMK